MAKLILRYPNNVIKEVDFDQTRLRIGTASDNDVVVENEDVEEHQAEIEMRDGAFSLKDLSENKSTTVNGKTFETISITYGDRIAFGPVIGLFYPPQKTKMGERSKLMIFMAAGAGILIVAIALIFFLISRPDYTDVISGAALVEGTEQTVSPNRRQSVEEITQRPAGFPEIDEQGLKTGATLEGREGGARQGLFSSLRNRGEKLVLAEPSEEYIGKRQAVAIPRGIGRLFFKKQPVMGIRADALGTEAAAVEEEGQEAIGEEAEEAFPLVETIPEVTEIPGQQTEFTVEGEALEDRGSASRLLKPFRRLGNLFGGEAEVEPLTEIPLIPTAQPLPGKSLISLLRCKPVKLEMKGGSKQRLMIRTDQVPVPSKRRRYTARRSCSRRRQDFQGLYFPFRGKRL